MATHDLKPKNVVRALDIKFSLKREKGQNDKHKDRQEEPVSEAEQDQPS